MGNTDSSVIKLPNGYRLNKIDDCTYELVKIDDFKKGDFLFAKSRTGDLLNFNLIVYRAYIKYFTVICYVKSLKYFPNLIFIGDI